MSRVVRAWGRWRFATDAFIGHRAPTSAHQRALNRAYGKRRTHEDYLTALRGGALRLGGEIISRVRVASSAEITAELGGSVTIPSEPRPATTAEPADVDEADEPEPRSGRSPAPA